MVLSRWEKDVEQRRIVRVLSAITAQPQGPLTDRLCCAAQQQLASCGVGVALAVNDDLAGDVVLRRVRLDD